MAITHGLRTATPVVMCNCSCSACARADGMIRAGRPRRGTEIPRAGGTDSGRVVMGLVSAV
eukprot:4426515-Prymnesium_polylepis.1